MSKGDAVYVGFSNGKKGCLWNEENAKVQSFDELELVPGLLENLHKMFKTGKNSKAAPLPIQKFALKPAIEGEDINCLSATGRLLRESNFYGHFDANVLTAGVKYIIIIIIYFVVICVI